MPPAAGALGALAAFSALGAGFWSPHAIKAAAAMTETTSWLLFMGSPGGCLSEGASYASPHYFCDRIHFTSALISASGTAAFGGMGIWPHLPALPFLTLSKRAASAPLLPRYFAATSLYAGPITFLSAAWQARQPC